VAERKGYARHLKYEYGKDLPLYGILVNKWRDNRIRKTISTLDKIRRTKPICLIERNKEKVIEKHA